MNGREPEWGFIIGNNYRATLNVFLCLLKGYVYRGVVLVFSSTKC